MGMVKFGRILCDLSKIQRLLNWNITVESVTFLTFDVSRRTYDSSCDKPLMFRFVHADDDRSSSTEF